MTHPTEDEDAATQAAFLRYLIARAKRYLSRGEYDKAKQVLELIE